MVRLSTPNDLNGIVSVWKEAFGDSEKDIRFFLDNHYKADNAVVYDSNGEVASVLFLIDGFMHIKGKDYPSYYLYAACTMKKYRGRGIMSEMLEFTKNVAFNRQKFFVALKPAEDSLYNYYSRFGYQPVFSKKKAVFELTDITDNTSIINNETDIDFSLLRDNSFKSFDYFKWDNNAVDFAIKHHKYYGGNIAFNCNGYLLYSISDDFLYVKETTLPSCDIKKMASIIALKHGVNKIYCELPFYYGLICDNIKTVKSGMLLPVCEEAKDLILIIDNAYLSLTLD